MAKPRRGPSTPRVTLEDVARAAGVSRALVSIVMRGAPGASASTRERVQSVAEQLGYRPDASARALAGKSSRLIGVVFGAGPGVHLGLLDGLYSEAERLGYTLLLGAITDSWREDKTIQSLGDFSFDALIRLGPAIGEPAMIDQLPLVVVGWHVDDPRVDIVRTSDDTAMRLSVEHLVSLGHRRIAHLSGGSGIVSTSRKMAYQNAMRASGLDREIRTLDGRGETYLDGQLAAVALLRSRRALPTAVIAYNDHQAVAAIAVLQQHGIHIPRDMSVVGFEDSHLVRAGDFGLTRIEQNPEEIARIAIDVVNSRLHGTPIEKWETILDPTIRIHSTTGPAPVRPARRRGR